MTQMEKLLLLLGLNISPEATEGESDQDAALRNKLSAILDSVTEQLKMRLGGVDEVPTALAYIVTEVAVARYNRIGSEGMASHNVEGESIGWATDDFASFADEIDQWRNSNGSGKVRVKLL